MSSQRQFFKARIEKVVEATDERGKAYHTYFIEAQAVWTSQPSYIIFRRYSEFVELKKSVDRYCRDNSINTNIRLELPGKTMGGNRKPEVVEKRMIGLQKFLLSLGQIPKSGLFPAVQIFFKATEKDKARAPKERIPKFTQEYGEKHSSTVAREVARQINLDDPFGAGIVPNASSTSQPTVPGNPFDCNKPSAAPVSGNPFGEGPVTAPSPLPAAGNPFGNDPPTISGPDAGNPFDAPTQSMEKDKGENPFDDNSVVQNENSPPDLEEDTFQDAVDEPELQDEHSDDVDTFPDTVQIKDPSPHESDFPDQTGEALGDLTLEETQSLPTSSLPPGFP
eukprot:UC4_evm1s118